MISFFRPAAWGWASLAIVIALVYLWHFRPKQQTVATYFLWQRALARRPVWFRLRFWASLATQLLVFLLLVAALAEPYWPQLFAARRTIVLVLDVSASMSATDVQPTRFAPMQAEAQRAAAGLRRGETMAVVAAGSLIRMACPFTGDKDRLSAAIAAVPPSDGTTRVAEAVALARRLLTDKRNPRIMVVSDGGFPEAAALAAAEDVQLHVVRGNGRNVGITAVGEPVTAARLTATQRGARDTSPVATRLTATQRGARDTSPVATILTEVTNFTAESVPGVVSSPDAAVQPAASPREAIPAGGTAYRGFAVAGGDDRRVSLTLDARDDLAADNTAACRVSVAPHPTVTLVTAGAPALEAALQTQQQFVFQSAATVPADGKGPGIVVLHRQVPKPLPSGPLLIIEPTDSSALWEMDGELQEAGAGVARVGDNAALLGGVALADALIEGASRIKLPQSAEILAATAAGDPLYAAIERPEGRVLVLAVKLDKSDLTLRHDFPRLIGNALAWLLPEVPQAAASVTTGEAITLPPRGGPWRLKPPQGEELKLPPEETLAVLDRAGLWTATGDDGKTVTYASNLASVQESDLRQGADVPSDELAVPEAVYDRPLWMLLVGAAVILLVAEWCLFHRRIIV